VVESSPAPPGAPVSPVSPVSPPEPAAQPIVAAAVVDPTTDTSCDTAQGTDGCFPHKEFTEAACGGGDPSVAVRMFHAGTAWTRAYVTRNLESWDPARRTRTTRSRLSLDEEVIVLHAYKPAGGVMLIGSKTTNGWTSVDAIRADGSCVSLMADEIALRRPPAPTHAPIAWDKLNEPLRDQLLAAPDLKKMGEAMVKTCATGGEKRCIQARVKLTDAAVLAAGAVASTSR
jgi:hypothetical protein